jgi:hypothetical protein
MHVSNKDTSGLRNIYALLLKHRCELAQACIESYHCYIRVAFGSEEDKPKEFVSLLAP